MLSTVLPHVDPVPVGRTARRLEWQHLPPAVRALVEQRTGSPVVSAASQGAGFTPGFASALTCADGSSVFVKAASKKAQRAFADAYREEVRKLRALPPGLPAPRVLWDDKDDLWVVLGLELVPGANPVRPWRPDQLAACLDSLEVLATRLTPAPLPLATFADEFADCLSGWDHVRRTVPDLPHLEDAAALASAYREATAGDTLVHTDARDDNFVLGPGGAVLCDWNWPVCGAAWIDTVLLLIAASGDGLDVDDLLRQRPVARGVDPERIDSLLALVAGYFFVQGDLPAPGTSPYLRQHQRWYRNATWSWLCRRRGWL